MSGKKDKIVPAINNLKVAFFFRRLSYRQNFVQFIITGLNSNVIQSFEDMEKKSSSSFRSVAKSSAGTSSSIANAAQSAAGKILNMDSSSRGRSSSLSESALKAKDRMAAKAAQVCDNKSLVVQFIIIFLIFSFSFSN